jgi:paraquat-inducible protein B
MNPKNRWTSSGWIWVVPILSLAFTGYLLFAFMDWGQFEARIVFDEADGIEVGKTKIKYRGVNVGQVTEVHLSSDTKVVIVHAHLDKDVKPLLKEGGTFWLIGPNIGLGEIQGMGTILAGPYLQLQPSRRLKNGYFSGISRAQRAGERFDGVTFKLHSPDTHSLKVGNPILYRGMRIGAVTALRFVSDARLVEIDSKISEEYVYLVRTNTVFWESSGIQADVGLLGAEINIPTVDALLSGGITFATPDKAGPPAKAGHVFALNPKLKDEWLTWAPALKS